MNSTDFSTLYHSEFRTTVRFMMARGLSADRAEEVAQAAWCKGWERIEQLRDPGSLGPWINTIALNVYRGQFRRAPMSELPESVPQPETDPVAAIDAKRLLAQCAPADREVLEQFYIKGYTSREIARRIKASAGAVRIRLLRARRRLAELCEAPEMGAAAAA